ncbi:MAG TPA: secondary thiamine-phosphate synthase enzyme YjbQ [Nitrospiria bacterium]|nr:secondary thiamine-phosphate synthase enzyme YjbQ [Nitrospiria bacterium]
MRKIIRIKTTQQNELVDITGEVRSVVEDSGMQNGICALYAHGATAAIMIQENWDESVPRDVVDCLAKLVPEGVWLHDRQDDNGAAHIKAGLVGPSETIPIIDGSLGLSRWQGVFLCEFDGPREERTVYCTLLADPVDPA